MPRPWSIGCEDGHIIPSLQQIRQAENGAGWVVAASRYNSQIMKNGLLAVMVGLTASVVAPAAVAADWYAQYEKGVRLIEQGNGAEAKVALEAALAARQAEGVQLQIGRASCRERVWISVVGVCVKKKR